MNSTKKNGLISEIYNALKSVNFGSVEIFVQDKIVTQITVRNIKKTSVGIHEKEKKAETPEFRKNIHTRPKIRINLHS